MQRRDPPAYLVWAAATMTRRDYRLADAMRRGVTWSIYNEVWVNRTAPADPAQLATILGLAPADVAAALPDIMGFFEVVNGELRCPELDSYRAHLDARHEKLSAGGKAGADITNRKKTRPKKTVKHELTDDTATPSACPTATPTASTRPLNPVQPNPINPNPVFKERSSGIPEPDPWLRDFAGDSETLTTAAAYAARRG